MTGLYLKEPFQLEYRDPVEVRDEVGKNEVLIQMEYGGICGSDLKAYKGELGHVVYPVRVGHELVGRVLQSGSEVSLAQGERVVVQPNQHCGRCQYCLNGKKNICSDKRSLGINMDGGFSSTALIHSDYVYPIREGVPDPQSVLIEPLAVVVHAFEKVKISSITTVAVVGCGTEGLLATALALYKGASVTAFDINPNKLKIAERLGRVTTALTGETVHDGFDVVIECAGTPSGMETSFSLVKPGGSLVLLGITQEPVRFPALQVVRNEISIFGSIIYDTPRDFYQSMTVLADERFMVTPIISKIYRLQEYQAAFADALSGDYGKIVLRLKGER